MVLKVLAFIVPLASIPLGILSSQFGWFGPSIEELSDRQNQVLNILIQPADYAFSIWSAIYLGVLGLAVVQAFPPGSRNPRYARARLPLILNMVVNFCWFVATQREWGGVSAGLLWAQFGTAVWLYYALELPKTKVYGLERWLRVSVSLYVGWLTVANVVTTAYVLERLGWSGWGLGDVTWTVIMLVVASAVGLFARFAWRDPRRRVRLSLRRCCGKGRPAASRGRHRRAARLRVFAVTRSRYGQPDTAKPSGCGVTVRKALASAAGVDAIFIVVATLSLAALGWVVQTGAFPWVRFVTSPAEALTASSSWERVAFGVYMFTAVALGLLLPLAALSVWGRHPSVRAALLPYTLVLLVQTVVEGLFARIFFPGIVVVVGFVYTLYRVGRLWRARNAFATSAQPAGPARSFVGAVLGASFVFWSFNAIFLITLVTLWWVRAV